MKTNNRLKIIRINFCVLLSVLQGEQHIQCITPIPKDMKIIDGK